MSEKMRAVCIHEYGSPEVLQVETIDRPEPTGEQLLIRVHAAGINPVDYKTRQGSAIAGRLGQNPFPIILGWDIAGVVEQAPADSAYQVGDSIYSMVAFPELGSAYAGYVVASPDEIAPMPTSLDFATAASVPLAALTAWQGLIETAHLQAGQTVLVHGATGGVGRFAVQIAKAHGATVIGTASSNGAEYAAALGVDQFIAYDETRFEEAVQDVDIAFVAVGGETLERTPSVIKEGGILVSIVGAPPEAQTKSRNIDAHGILVYTSGEQLATITEMIDARKIQARTEHQFPLSQAAEAHRLFENREIRGKVVLTM